MRQKKKAFIWTTPSSQKNFIKFSVHVCVLGVALHVTLIVSGCSVLCVACLTKGYIHKAYIYLHSQISLKFIYPVHSTDKLSPQLSVVKMGEEVEKMVFKPLCLITEFKMANLHFMFGSKFLVKIWLIRIVSFMSWTDVSFYRDYHEKQVCS